MVTKQQKLAKKIEKIQKMMNDDEKKTCKN